MKTTKKPTKATANKKRSEKKTDIHAFPGYPPYPADEDITRQATKIDADIEDLSTAVNSEKEAKYVINTKNSDDLVDEALTSSRSELTKEDFEALGPKDLTMDMGEDEGLKHRASPIDFAGGDMDVPGSELDDNAEATGSEDEENNVYSLGGENHEDLEEDRS